MRARIFAFASLSAALVVLPAPNARADEPSTSTTSTAAPAATERVWYGWQTLLVDGAGAVIGGTGVVASQVGAGVGSALLIGGIGTFALGGPLIHISHREYARGAESLGMRVGLPILGLVLGFAAAYGGTCNDCGPYGGVGRRALDGAAIGSVVGMFGASALDAGLLAYKPESKRVVARGPTFAFTPNVDPRHGAYGLSFVGRGF